MSFTILIVDDSTVTRMIIKRAINAAGLPIERIVEAPNGLAGLQMLAATRCDVVLADLHMPEMDGAEMTRRILADPKLAAVPVVIVSAEPNAERIGQLQDLGIRGYLKKPFTPEAVRDVLCQVLGVAHA